jgi:hypothetical protein
MAFANLFLSGQKETLTPENLQEILEILKDRGIEARFFSEFSLEKNTDYKDFSDIIFPKKDKTLKGLMSDAEFVEVVEVNRQFQILEENDF